MASDINYDPQNAVMFDVNCNVSFKRQFTFNMFTFMRLLNPLMIMIVLCIYTYFFRTFTDRLIMLFFTAMLFPVISAAAAITEVTFCRDIPDRYIFYPNQIENICHRGKIVINHGQIKEIYETAGYFYIINIGRNIYCVIDKDCFIVGNAADMRKYFSDMPNVKFRKFCK